MKLSSIQKTYLDRAIDIFYANTKKYKDRLDAIRATSKETGISSKIISAELNRRKHSKKSKITQDTQETPERKEEPKKYQGNLFPGPRINVD
jgi:hypothetical protein